MARATVPLLITTAKLTSSTVAEPHAPAAYNAGTTYALGDIVSVAADFATYESLAAGNLGNTPSTSPLSWRQIGYTETAYNVATVYAIGDTCSFGHRVYEALTAGSGNALPVPPETENANWQDIGPTMRYAMFDLDRNTQTVGPSPLTVVITPGERVNTAGLTGMVGNELLIKATSVSSGGIIYPLAYLSTRTYNYGDCMTVGFTTCYKCLVDGTVGIPAPNATYWAVVSGAIFDLNTREVYDALTYYFEPFSTRPAKTVFNIPPVSDVIITVTLTATSGNCKIGALTIGTNVYIGKLLKPTSNTGTSFSSVTTDIYGKTTLVKRPMLRKLKGVLLIDSFRIDKMLQLREDLDAEPALYTGTEEDGDWTGATTLVGVLQDFPIETTDGEDHARIPFTVQEI